MKRILAAALALTACAPAFAEVGVSVSVGQPGFFGQINIGDFPQPRLVYAQPVVIQQSPQYVNAQPIYLHVPPGHEKHWRKHCAAYNACGRPVYFVRDDWYQNEYVPHYRGDHGDHGPGGPGERDDRRGPPHDHGDDRGDDRDHGRDHDH